ncbi:MAG: hypothetical protein CM15mP49_18640 [Actinomycetota bacterium]|nr:MAG: hypothetical protein CM15mP49_18640 [Actinomycetota bacterium]GIS38759.1 MAG: hypothetical protein Ct9H90mP11_00790 [Acidimicrobiales bacterium]
MLMPRKVAHRKHHRGRMKGNAKGGNEVSFGDFGIQALEPDGLLRGKSKLLVLL